MKQNVLFLLVTVCLYGFHFPVVAQVLNQDARGGTTILHNGSTINFDVANSAVSFAFNRFSDERIDAKKSPDSWMPLFGVRARAASKEGIANLFSKGNVTPDATIGISYGFSKTTSNLSISPLLSVIRADRAKMEKLNEFVEKAVRAKFDSLELDFSTDTVLLTSLTAVMGVTGVLDLPTVLEDIGNERKSTNEAASTALEKLLAYSIRMKNFYETNKVSETLTNKVLDRIERSYWEQRKAYFLNASLTGSEFMYEKDPTNADLTARYKKQNFTGIKLGVGANWSKAGRRIWGVGVGYERASTFDLLDDSEITLSTAISATVVGGSQKIETKKVFTGYSGTYQAFDRLYVHADLIRFFPGAEAEESVVVGNLYVRHLQSLNSAIYPTVTNIGAGAYFFKNSGVFLGGLFLEAQDVFDQLGQKEFSSQKKTVLSRFVVGLVTKFSIGESIIDYRPILR